MSGNWKVQHFLAQDCSHHKNLSSPHSSFLYSVLFLYISTYVFHVSFSGFQIAHFLFSALFIQIHYTFFLPIFSCTWLNSLLKACISPLQFYDATGTIFSPKFFLLKPENGLLQKILFSVLFGTPTRFCSTCWFRTHLGKWSFTKINIGILANSNQLWMKKATSV